MPRPESIAKIAKFKGQFDRISKAIKVTNDYLLDCRGLLALKSDKKDAAEIARIRKELDAMQEVLNRQIQELQDGLQKSYQLITKYSTEPLPSLEDGNKELEQTHDLLKKNLLDLLDNHAVIHNSAVVYREKIETNYKPIIAPAVIPERKRATEATPKAASSAGKTRPSVDWMKDEVFDNVEKTLRELGENGSNVGVLPNYYKEFRRLVDKVKDAGDKPDPIDKQMLERIVKTPGWGFVPGQPQVFLSEQQRKVKRLQAKSYMAGANLAGTEPVVAPLIKEFNSYLSKMVGRADQKKLQGTPIPLAKKSAKDKFKIFCVWGPPGTGKTTVAKELANAMGMGYRDYSMEQVKDIEEITGRPTTWQGGGKPNVIHQAMIETGKEDVFICLDEVDKLPPDVLMALGNFLGSQATFEDRYLNTKFDKRRAAIFLTANDLSMLPPHLRSRIEPIYFGGYDDKQKMEILKNMVFSLLSGTGRTHTIFDFITTNDAYLNKKYKGDDEVEHDFEGFKKAGSGEEDVIKFIVENYITEAGVREAEGLLADIIAAAQDEYDRAASEIPDGSEPIKTKIDVKFIEKVLGPPGPTLQIKKLTIEINDQTEKLNKIKKEIDDRLMIVFEGGDIPKSELDSLLKQLTVQQRKLYVNEAKIINLLQQRSRNPKANKEILNKQIKDHRAELDKLESLIENTKKEIEKYTSGKAKEEYSEENLERQEIIRVGKSFLNQLGSKPLTTEHQVGAIRLFDDLMKQVILNINSGTQIDPALAKMLSDLQGKIVSAGLPSNPQLDALLAQFATNKDKISAAAALFVPDKTQTADADVKRAAASGNVSPATDEPTTAATRRAATETGEAEAKRAAVPGVVLPIATLGLLPDDLAKLQDLVAGTTTPGAQDLASLSTMMAKIQAAISRGEEPSAEVFRLMQQAIGKLTAVGIKPPTGGTSLEAQLQAMMQQPAAQRAAAEATQRAAALGSTIGTVLPTAADQAAAAAGRRTATETADTEAKRLATSAFVPPTPGILSKDELGELQRLIQALASGTMPADLPKASFDLLNRLMTKLRDAQDKAAAGVHGAPQPSDVELQLMQKVLADLGARNIQPPATPATPAGSDINVDAWKQQLAAMQQAAQAAAIAAASRTATERAAADTSRSTPAAVLPTATPGGVLTPTDLNQLQALITGPAPADAQQGLARLNEFMAKFQAANRPGGAQPSDEELRLMQEAIKRLTRAGIIPADDSNLVNIQRQLQAMQQVAAAEDEATRRAATERAVAGNVSASPTDEAAEAARRTAAARVLGSTFGSAAAGRRLDGTDTRTDLSGALKFTGMGSKNLQSQLSGRQEPGTRQEAGTELGRDLSTRRSTGPIAIMSAEGEGPEPSSRRGTEFGTRHSTDLGLGGDALRHHGGGGPRAIMTTQKDVYLARAKRVGEKSSLKAGLPPLITEDGMKDLCRKMTESVAKKSELAEMDKSTSTIELDRMLHAQHEQKQQKRQSKGKNILTFDQWVDRRSDKKEVFENARIAPSTTSSTAYDIQVRTNTGGVEQFETKASVRLLSPEESDRVSPESGLPPGRKIELAFKDPKPRDKEIEILLENAKEIGRRTGNPKIHFEGCEDCPEELARIIKLGTAMKLTVTYDQKSRDALEKWEAEGRRGPETPTR